MAMWVRSLMETLAADITGEMRLGRSLILAPHQDDELLGCGGMIATKARLGAYVAIAFLTDGRLGVAAEPAVAQAIRDEEAALAAAALGLAGDRLAFLGFEDGRLSDHIEPAAERVRGLIADLGIDTLFAPYHREFHPDHAAGWRIGDACRRDGMRFYEYPIWFGRWLRGWIQRMAAPHLQRSMHTVKVNVVDVNDAKARARAAYRSQAFVFERRPGWGPRFPANMYEDYELLLARE